MYRDIEYTDKTESAVCNLASISLKSCLNYRNLSKLTVIIYSKPGCIYCDAAENFCKYNNINYKKESYNNLLMDPIKPFNVKWPQIYKKVNEYTKEHIGGFQELLKFTKPNFNFEKLKDLTKSLVYNLNNIIDYNYYPTEKTKKSNTRHRPIGIGVQGLANVFFEIGISFDSNDASILNSKIFETIYYGSLEASCELAEERENYIKAIKILRKNNINQDTQNEIDSLINKHNVINEN